MVQGTGRAIRDAGRPILVTNEKDCLINFLFQRIIIVRNRKYSHSTSYGKNGLRDQSNVLQIPEIGCLEEIHIGDAILDAGLLEPAIGKSVVQ